MSFFVLNVREMLDEGREDVVRAYIASYSCAKEKDGVKKVLNPEIEKFLFKNAVHFSEKKTAISYLVFDDRDNAFVGYFALSHKPTYVPAEGLSRNVRDQLKRFSKLDEDNLYHMSAFFIAQFGKNYAVDNGTRISGAELMDLALSQLLHAQKLIGGTMIYLDCEEDSNLISFYETQKFKLFGQRLSPTDGKEYFQLLRFI